MYHFLKPTQELKALRFGMDVAFIMFIKELWRNGGGTAATAICHRIFFCYFPLNFKGGWADGPLFETIKTNAGIYILSNVSFHYP